MVEQSSVVGGSAPISRWKKVGVSAKIGETLQVFHIPEGIGDGGKGNIDELGVVLSVSPM
jgi:hypothetical protein